MTKRLLIMRHGKALPGNGNEGDFDRVLAERGQEEVDKIAEYLKKNKLFPERVFSSSAARTKETTRRFIDVVPVDEENIIYSQTLYLAPALDYLKMIEHLDDTVSCVLLVGHNPGVSQLVAYLTGDVVELKTSTVADIVFTGSWDKIEHADLKHVWIPKFLD